MAKSKSGVNIKVINKRTRNVQKKEKYKRNRKKKQEKKKALAAEMKTASQHHQKLEEKECDIADVEDMVEKKDLAFLKKSAKNFSFLNEHNNYMQDHTKRNANMRSKNLDNEEAEYEELPRKKFKHEPEKRVKFLLPIKDSHGVIQRFEVDQVEEIQDDINAVLSTPLAKPVHLESMTPQQLLLKRNKKLMLKKENIALFATRVIADPEKNTKALKELRLMLDEKDRDISITVRKLAAASLLEVFKDILPEYRIRAATDKEKEQRMKKETKELQIFEQTVLQHYKLYLQRLELMLKGLKQKGLKREDSLFSLGELSIKCLCDLLLTKPAFNYRSNIISLIVPFADNKCPEISDHVCDSIKRLFCDDKLGEVSLEVVKHIARLLKEKNYNVQPKVLKTFLALKIQSISEENQTKKVMTRKEKMMKLSRNERKRSKQMESLERELEATRAEESIQTKTKFQTDIISQIFVIYFRILKKAVTSVLLPAVLEGLSKFAHLINVEFFDDLVSAFHLYIDSGVLSYKDSLHCVQTVFTILSGQGESLNVDPLRFYTHLYKSLLYIHAGSTNEDLPLLLKCIDLAFVKRRKQVTIQRVLAFIKRLSGVAAHVTVDGIVSILLVIRILLQNHKSADILLETDVMQGSGIYLPELEEPEYCNANATSLWELHLLQKHHHPLVNQLSSYVLHGCPLQKPPVLTNLFMKSPTEVWDKFSNSEVVIPPCSMVQGRSSKRKFVSCLVSGSLQQQATDILQSDIQVNFSDLLDLNK